MPNKIIRADGKTYSVPNDATDDEINQIVGPAPSVNITSGGDTSKPGPWAAGYGPKVVSSNPAVRALPPMTQDLSKLPQPPDPGLGPTMRGLVGAGQGLTHLIKGHDSEGLPVSKRRSTAEMIEGGLEAASPLGAEFAAAKPVAAAIGLGAGYAAQRGTQAAGDTLGLEPDTTRLASDVAGVAAGYGAGRGTTDPAVAATTVGAAKGAWRGATDTAILPMRFRGMPALEIPYVPASVAGAIEGAAAGHYVPGIGAAIGGAVGAVVPPLKGAIAGGRSALADFRASQRVPTTTPDYAPAAPGGAVIGPQPPRVTLGNTAANLPSGRVPGPVPQPEVVPRAPRGAPAWQSLPPPPQVQPENLGNIQPDLPMTPRGAVFGPMPTRGGANSLPKDVTNVENTPRQSAPPPVKLERTAPPRVTPQAIFSAAPVKVPGALAQTVSAPEPVTAAKLTGESPHYTELGNRGADVMKASALAKDENIARWALSNHLMPEDLEKMPDADFAVLQRSIPTGKIAQTGRSTKYLPRVEDPEFTGRKQAAADMMRRVMAEGNPGTGAYPQ